MKKQWQAATAVIEQLEQAGYEAVFVGGAVRDLLLNRPLHDIDVATSAEPAEVKVVFHKTVDVGIEHGTVLVLDAGEPIEVTTYRTDGEYADHRRPDTVQFVRSLAEDLQRRDFTMNAMAMRLDHSVVDLFQGQRDLAHKQIRAVGDPLARFAEDALRMLRAVRFAAQLGFHIEEATFQAIQQLAHQIAHIAMERISMELEKIWVSAQPMRGLTLLQESGLAQYLPGKPFDPLAFAHFRTHEPDVGWAYFFYVQQDAELIRAYRLSNKTKHFVLAVHEAVAAVSWTAASYFRFSVEVLEAAYDVLDWQGHALPFEKAAIAQQKAQLPLQTKQDLAVTGHDLIEWHGGKKGPWVSKAIDGAIAAILSGHIPNERQHIKDWFLHDFS